MSKHGARRVRSPENILANKISAVLSRNEPKDLADIWGFCTRLGLSLPDAIHHADGKAAGIFPPDLARALCTLTQADWQLIRWIIPPPFEEYQRDLTRLGETLLELPPRCTVVNT